MPTNTTEYQREYQREYRRTHPQKQYRKSKEVKMEVKKVKVFDLHPPRAPVKVEQEDGVCGFNSPDREGVSSGLPDVATTSSKTIDFNNLPGYKEWCNSSETKRFYYFTKIGKVHRGTKERMFWDLSKTEEQLEIVKTIPKYMDYKNVMKELKEVLKKRNE